MDIMVILGLIFAGLCIFIGFPEIQTSYKIYINYQFFILVVGGTFASTMISSSVYDFKNIMIVFFRLIFPKRKIKAKELISILVKLAEATQTQTKQDLPLLLPKKIDDGFLNRGVQLIADGLDRDFIKKTLETDISELHRRHLKLIQFVRTMGTYAPMFGMVATVLGLVKTLQDLNNTKNVSSGMSLAMVSTLYGLFCSAIIFIPIANKLKSISEKETLIKEIMKEGLLMIIDKAIPLKVEYYLLAYLENKYKNVPHKD